MRLVQLEGGRSKSFKESPENFVIGHSLPDVLMADLSTPISDVMKAGQITEKTI